MFEDLCFLRGAFAVVLSRQLMVRYAGAFDIRALNARPDLEVLDFG